MATFAAMMTTMMRKIIPLAILAGICISIGCVVNLRVGGVAGAVLFAFGLTTVVYYGLKLYTGTAGFIRMKGDWTMLCLVLLGNIIGCLLSAWLIAYAQPDCIEPASKILAGRLAKGPLACFLLAIGCGFIMTTAVEFARKGKMLPLLLGVPVFILCGFAHSIADAFYFLVSPSEQLLKHASGLSPNACVDFLKREQGSLCDLQSISYLFSSLQSHAGPWQAPLSEGCL